ncbi:MAG: MFS transporter [Burkholderiaceae bacterium]|nr:MFS transporter [Burkholderiaceae bacterium]
MSFVTTRRLILGTVLASFVLSFFHRIAPAAIASELARDLAINATLLGTLAATYFYVYTLLQVPVGVLADTLGPRKIISCGSVVAGIGSLVFALAPTFEIAAAGRTLVGIGVSVAFIAVLKISADWFPANRFATLSGATMFAGNLGAVVAGAPLAWVVTQTSWRTVFVALSFVSILLGIVSWLVVRDTPQARGFAPVNPSAAPRGRVHWKHALASVLRNRATWPGFFVNVGIGGSFLAFAGLWAVPWLEHTYRMSRVTAAQHVSALLIGVAFGSLAIGMLSDRLGSRRAVMRVFAMLYVASWLPLMLHVDWPVPATIAWFLLMGLLIPGFTLSWTIAKEVNRPEHSGIATSVVNVGIFFGAGVLQPAVGWLIDRGSAAGNINLAWQQGLLLLAAAAAFGALMTTLVTDQPYQKPRLGNAPQ